jgi:hypothetical protein
MLYLILLLLLYLVVCANGFLYGRAGGAVDKFVEPRGRWPVNSLGTTALQRGGVNEHSSFIFGRYQV